MQEVNYNNFDILIYFLLSCVSSIKRVKNLNEEKAKN